MKRLLAIFLLTTAFVLPIFTSCVPSGYETGNPNRPADNQVDVESLPQGENPPAQPEAQPETQPDASGGGDESGE